MKKFNKLFCIILIICSIKTTWCMDANDASTIDALTNSSLYNADAKRYLKHVNSHALNSEIASFLRKRINDADKILSGQPAPSPIAPLKYLDSKHAYRLSLPIDDPRQRIPLDKIELTKESLKHLKSNPHARMVYYYGFIMEENVKRLLQIKLRCRIGKRGKLDNLEKVSKEEFNKKVGTIDPDELNTMRLKASRNFAQAVLNKLR